MDIGEWSESDGFNVDWLWSLEDLKIGIGPNNGGSDVLSKLNDWAKPSVYIGI